MLWFRSFSFYVIRNARLEGGEGWRGFVGGNHRGEIWGPTQGVGAVNM
jgi:hypothetical protein